MKPISETKGLRKRRKFLPRQSQSRLPHITLAHRRALALSQRNPALAQKLSQMRLKIAPIVNITTGLPPPSFPTNMLQLFLLTEAELDCMAAFYSQIDPSPSPTSFTFAYPQTMDWNRELLRNDPRMLEDEKLSDLERLQVKMRMFARFIGMRGAETPLWEYERSVEILAKRIERQVRYEEDSEQRRKVFMGPKAWQA